MMRILVADDSRAQRLCLEKNLTEWGYEVQSVTDGESAWRALQEEDAPPLTLLDWVMPAPDGPELCRKIRAHPRLKSVYVILLTCRGGAEETVEGLDSGADDYVLKSADLRELRARVRVGARVVELRQNQLAQAEDLVESSRRKDEFLAMLAHELRNPLAAIASGVEVLQGSDPDEPCFRRATDSIGQQTEHLTRLADDLLNIARIAQGKIDLRREPVELAPLVKQAFEAANPFFRARKQEVGLTLVAEPLLVNADRARLIQVVGNLLNNASKYTDVGGHIHLSARAEGNEVALRVLDTGIGIAAEMLPRVFDLFAQADCSLDRSQGGLGIGLTLVRALVEMHGGSVQAFSQGLGQGAEFVVRLPLLSGPCPASRRDALSGPSGESHPRRILIADDNDDLVELWSVMLRRLGHDVSVAEDGPSALDLAVTFQPEVVLLDIGLPKLDGYEVARRMRRQVGLADVFLVGVSGYGDEHRRRQALEAGFDETLVKPVRLVHLQSLLANRRIRSS
jgi:signal transduction histidine kinase